MWKGEGFGLVKLPTGSRVVYAPEPFEALEDPEGAIRHALEHPTGESDPLSALLRPGMTLTICFDDISLPLPPMEAPDIRQMIIEAVLDQAAAAGVDDVVLIAALALHRRMTEPELRHALGDRVYDAFAPHGLLLQHDAEDPSNLIHLGVTKHGEDVEINKRAAESDLLVYVNINLVAFSTFLGDLVGQVFALLVLTVAAGEAAIGLAILVTYFRNRGTIAVEDINLMKG